MKRTSGKGRLNKRELQTLARLLKKMPGVPHIPKELFLSVMRKNVPVTIELAIVRGKRIMLAYRHDPYFTGWHFPGSFMIPRETFVEAVRRTAFGELGLKIQASRLIKISNASTNKRFHFVSLFFLCSTSGKPKNGKWFSTCPTNIIPEHKTLWRWTQSYLRDKKGSPLLGSEI